MALQTKSPPYLEPANLLEIEPSFRLPYDISFSYLHTIQQILKTLIPESLSQGSLEKEAFFFRLNKSLPLIFYPKNCSSLEEAFTISFLCSSEYSHGVGRYLTDTLSRWLIPGKQLPMPGGISLNFRFRASPTHPFFLSQEMIAFQSLEDLQVAKKNLPHLLNEMRINIMAVCHARYITSLRSASHYKNVILKENLSLLLNPLDEQNQCLFNQFHGVLTEMNKEEKMEQIKKNLSYLLHARPKAFGREIFYEIAQYSLLFKERFSSTRSPNHISRLIAYQYLFKKVLQEKIGQAPSKRHWNFKILRIPISDHQNSIGILFGLNFLVEAEHFELRHFMEAVRSSLPYLEYVPDSIITDRRHEKIRFFYLEVVKKDEKPFTIQEIKHLKEKLPNELVRHIDTAAHPIFMPRNEEEILRNLIVLSKQIKYVRDLPQVSIHYDMQSDADLIFTVILVRLLKDTSLPIHQLLPQISNLKVQLDSVRNAGFLRKKYQKEAATLRISLNKEPFFRADSSVDLLRARQKIALQLFQVLGEFRDFNGGIILKQEEALTQLRKALAPFTPERELLLENYFYSLRPAIMQTVYDTSVLKSHFLLLESILSKKSTNSYEIASKTSGKYFLFFVQATTPSFKEAILEALTPLRIPSHDLTTASFEIDEAACLGFILRLDTPDIRTHFEQKIGQALQNWEQTFLL